MRKIIPILFLAFVSLTAMAQESAVASGPIMKFEDRTHNFGEIPLKEGKVSHEFKFTNEGTEPLIISKAKGSCGCTVPKYPRGPIMPGEEASVKVVFNPKGKKGKIHKTVTITHNSGVPGETKQVKLNIGGRIKQ